MNLNPDFNTELARAIKKQDFCTERDELAEKNTGVNGQVRHTCTGNETKLVTNIDIDKIPPADVQEVKHGHWKPNDNETAVFCSNCGAQEDTFFDDGQTVDASIFHYCWNCGAKMDEETE